MGCKITLPKLLFTKPTMCLNLLGNTRVYFVNKPSVLSSPLDHHLSYNSGDVQLYITLMFNKFEDVVIRVAKIHVGIWYCHVLKSRGTYMSF